jgi:hypothetical protein
MVSPTSLLVPPLPRFSQRELPVTLVPVLDFTGYRGNQACAKTLTISPIRRCLIIEAQEDAYSFGLVVCACISVSRDERAETGTQLL